MSNPKKAPVKKPKSQTKVAKRKQKSRAAKKAAGISILNTEIELPFKLQLEELAEVLECSISKVVQDLIAAFPEGIPPLKHVLRDANGADLQIELTEAERAYLDKGLEHKPTPLSCGSAIEHLLVALMHVEEDGMLYYTHPVGDVSGCTQRYPENLSMRTDEMNGFCKYAEKRRQIQMAIERKHKPFDLEDRLMERVNSFVSSNFGGAYEGSFIHIGL